jgi:cell division septation protein DedD
MRGVFDDRELEEAAPRHDTELTLSSVTLLLIFFALVLLCGLCFGLGYSMGNHGSRDSSVAQAPAASARISTPADGARPKPSANASAQTVAAVQSSTGAASVPAPVVAASGTASNASGQSGQSNQAAQWVAVKPALGAGANPVQPGLPAASAVTPALVPAGSLMVQIAAVSQPEDADVLMSALRRKGYAVVTRRDPLDGLIHVRIGPFKTLDDAEKWRQKLLNDGYNAIVQP